jgi:hypothetical protein
MPHVSIHYRIYLGAAHHRRPRNPQPWVEPYPSSEVDVSPGGVVTPFAPPTLPFTPPGGATVVPGFLFWSLTDGTGGRTQTTPALTETVGNTPLTLVAWYFLPPGGGGGPGGGGSAILIDAYSVRRGDFVDDDFVDVTSDPSLSLAANVEGAVPTRTEQTIQAFGGIPTGEGFDQWVTSPGGAHASGDVLTAPAGSGGLAIATYVHHPLTIPKLDVPREGVIILFGVANDAPGLVIPIGGGGPVPVGPWGPLVERMMSAFTMHADAVRLSKGAATRIQAVAANEVEAAAKELAELAAKGFRTG